MSEPKKPKVVPADPDVVAALAEIADHPEITLSRREILRFILIEPTKRSEEIQAILKLEDIGQTRGALNTAQNKLQTVQKGAATQVQTSRDSLLRHLQISTMRAEDLLAAVNLRRALLGLPELAELTADTKVDVGLSAGASAAEFNKQSALRDLTALADAAKGFPDLAKVEAAGIVTDLTTLEHDAVLLAALQRRTFMEKGLELVEGPECPLCDEPWDNEQHLRDHLKAKLTKSAEAQRVQDALLKKGTAVALAAIKVAGLLAPAQKIAEGLGEAAFGKLLANWKADLEALKASLTTVDGLTALKDRLTGGWLATPTAFGKGLSDLIEKVMARPDQSATVAAQTFLTNAQLRLDDWREAMRANKAAELAYKAAKAAYETYCTVLEEELNALYDSVEKDFSAFYRAINEDDESKFTAKLTPSEGKLDLEVKFYERGLFPPAAYHSEGHQDGMGVCLFPQAAQCRSSSYGRRSTSCP